MNLDSWVLAFLLLKVGKCASGIQCLIEYPVSHFVLLDGFCFLWFSSFLIQGHKEWLAEVRFLAVVSHPNLVKLLGYCSVDGERGIQRLLVYEYMPNKSLENHLFNRTMSTLPWKMRLQIILGAAEGLAYLHEGLEIQVIQVQFILFS